MTNKTGPAKSPGQPTTPRRMFTIAEREELWTLILAVGETSERVGERYASSYGDTLREQTKARAEALEWILARMGPSQ